MRKYVNALTMSLKPWGEKQEERVSKIPKIFIKRLAEGNLIL